MTSVNILISKNTVYVEIPQVTTISITLLNCQKEIRSAGHRRKIVRGKLIGRATLLVLSWHSWSLIKICIDIVRKIWRRTYVNATHDPGTWYKGIWTFNSVFTTVQRAKLLGLLIQGYWTLQYIVLGVKYRRCVGARHNFVGRCLVSVYLKRAFCIYEIIIYIWRVMGFRESIEWDKALFWIIFDQ